MAVFLPRTKPNRKNDSPGCPTILYRALIAAFFLAGSLAVSANLAAQDQSTPLIIPRESKVPEKKDNGPRAVAVLRRGANNKSSLVPIAILINGKFWDATAYKADPVPMALESGTVYEVERDGNSLGLFTIGSALHSTSPNADVPWIGTGTWTAPGSDLGKKASDAPTVPVGINAVDGPPRLTRKSSETSTGNAAPPAASSGNPPPSQPSGTSSGNSGDEPPRLTKSTTSPTPSGTAQTSPSSAGTSPTATNSGAASIGSNSTAAKPADSKPGDSKPANSQAAAAQVPADDSGASASARPRLRRGRPEVSFADEDVPGYSKVSSSSSAAIASASAAKTAADADKTPVETIPAISDAGGPQPRSFAFQWIPGEEGDRRKQMVDLAKQRLHAYLQAQAKATIKPASAQQNHHRPVAKSSAKDADPVFDDIHMTTYDLWVSNQPVMVFSAEAHMPPSATHSQANADLQYSILLVAYPDIYNNLHPLYEGVTDKLHLDLTPRLDLVDALDADGDGRGELLFRETSDAGTGWVIYRATADKLWKMFDSLNPE